MKTIVVATMAVFVLGIGPVMAQPCSTSNRLSQNAIKTALVGKWACAKDGSDMWNEQLVGNGNAGTFQECHEGGATVATNQGSWSTGNNPGRITYNYGAGGSYTYYMYGTSSPYTFCRPSDNKTYTVYITSCPPPTLNACP